MSGLMVALVLFAAFMHALWSTLIKSNGQAKANTTVFMACSAFLALFGLPFLPFPSLVSLPFLLASVVIQAGYMMLVGVIYQKGDVSQSYPVMRGCTTTSYSTGQWPASWRKIIAGRNFWHYSYLIRNTLAFN